MILPVYRRLLAALHANPNKPALLQGFGAVAFDNRKQK